MVLSIINNPATAKTMAAVQEKKSDIETLEENLVSGKKSLSNASVAQLAAGRLAAMKVHDYNSGKENIIKALGIVQMTESYVKDAQDSLLELKKIATSATGPMSDATRVSSLEPQFENLIDAYEESLQHFMYDNMPLLDGKFEARFITSSVDGSPTTEKIDLRNINLTAEGLGLTFGKTDVCNIRSNMNKLVSMFEETKPKIGGPEGGDAKSDLLELMQAIENDIVSLKAQTDNNHKSPEENLPLGAQTDQHMLTMIALKDAFTGFRNTYKGSFNSLNFDAAPSSNPNDTHSTDVVNALNDAKAALQTIIDTKFKAVDDAFEYDKSMPALTVDTRDNAMKAEAVIDAGLKKTHNAITKLQAKFSAFAKTKAVLVRNATLQNKIAHENTSVDPVATSAKINETKSQLVSAMTSLTNQHDLNKKVHTALYA